MKLLVSRLATRRLHETANYIHARNPAAALGVQQAIRNAFVLLAAYPSAGRSLRPDVRCFAIPRLPYLIYYRVDAAAEAVIIITVRHAARKRIF